MVKEVFPRAEELPLGPCIVFWDLDRSSSKNLFFCWQRLLSESGAGLGYVRPIAFPKGGNPEKKGKIFFQSASKARGRGKRARSRPVRRSADKTKVIVRHVNEPETEFLRVRDPQSGGLIVCCNASHVTVWSTCQ